MKYAGIDLSLRSTGISIIEDDGVGGADMFLDCYLVRQESKNEQLLVENADYIVSFLSQYTPHVIVLEGLAFGALSGTKDIIAGNFWYVRCQLAKAFPNSQIAIVPVTRWRKLVIPKERAKELKETAEKNWQKKEVVRKLRPEVKKIFDDYIKRSKLKKDSIHDLADSYFLAKYATSLDFRKNYPYTLIRKRKKK